MVTQEKLAGNKIAPIILWVFRRQARREGGEFSRAPTFGGGRRRSKILKIVFQVASF